MRSHLACVVVCAWLMTGCATTQNVSDETYKAPADDFKLVVLEPDIQVAVLTAGGLMEPRQDWTDTARGHVVAALKNQQKARGGSITIATNAQEAGGDPIALIELARLHTAVGNTIKLHKYSGISLPTKEDRFDWTLGDLAIDYGTVSLYNYALFIHAQDSFSSGGRVALQAAGFLGCMVGVCVIPQGGMQVAFASLVDLQTGQVVWFNFLASSVGDIRTKEGAKTMVDHLLTSMELGKKPQKAKRKPTRRA